MNGFWTGGAGACTKALRIQYDAELAALQTKLKSAADELQRRDIEQQITQQTETYHTKMRAIRRGLF